MDFELDTIHFNYMVDDEEISLPDNLKELIQSCLKQNKLPFNTNVKATIDTKTNDPIYTRQYPYPIIYRDFVNEEVERLLQEGIIRKSFSPYNSPIWIASRDPDNKEGKRKLRLVIDFKKINAQTIADKYPIPDVTTMLSNLGQAKYFTTIDLESGYHQIKVHENDIQKTAFSINGAKYEFVRMPFGLKNAPAIFQRALDDILHKYIGKFCYVYMDDILIFSKTRDEHLRHIELVIGALKHANMTISDKKTKIFATETEFLGHTVSHNCIKVNKAKVAAMQDFPQPKTIKQLRRFLGLTGYYRKFIKNYADIAKPLTILLRNLDSKITKHNSDKKQIDLNNDALHAFETIKTLMVQQLELTQPNFNAPLELYTDASNVGLGATLQQGGKPIIFISRTLTHTEQNYATNEKELLAIIWALQTLRNYLYGRTDTVIYSDHQPLSFSMSEKNPNTKLKRWQSIIEEYGCTLKYKPGRENLVADALSRQDYCNAMFDSDDDFQTAHSQISSPRTAIPRTVQPINSFKNQIFLEQNTNDTVENISIDERRKIKMTFSSTETLVSNIRQHLVQKQTNALYSSLETLSVIQQPLLNAFPEMKFLHTTTNCREISDENEIAQIIEETHNRAHRSYTENVERVKFEIWFNNMKKKFKEKVLNCQICKENKYERRPTKQLLGKTPIPNEIGEIVHIDKFFFGNKTYYSIIDKFSKFLILIPAVISSTEMISTVKNIFIKCKTVVTDNESQLNSIALNSKFKQFDIEHFLIPRFHSISNGTVEKAHSTIIEIARCLISQKSYDDETAIKSAVIEYNSSVHSVIKAKPNEVLHNAENFKHIPDLLKKQQEYSINRENKNRKEKMFKENQTVFYRNKRRNKKAKLYNKTKIKRINKNTIETKDGKILHKDTLRN